MKVTPLRARCLLALVRYGQEGAYAYQLAQAIGGRPSVVAYTLHILVDHGYAQTYWEHPARQEQRGSPRRRYFRLTASGRAALKQKAQP